MGTRFIATSAVETFSNPFTDVVTENPGSIAGDLTTRTYALNAVDYRNGSRVNIDLERLTQSGGFAEGDRLGDVGDISGTPFADVIRGSDPIEDTAEQIIQIIDDQEITFLIGLSIVNNPGQNDLEGLGGTDIIEGRDGGDFIDGGSGSDTASYESSPLAVTVTVNNPATAAFVASGGDATNDVLFSIENLVGSGSRDRLTGSSNSNILAGGRGSDTLDGAGGIDTVDYSRDLFFDPGTTFSGVTVRLGLNGASGTGTESQSSIDTLRNFENVIGSAGGDDIRGNELANVLDGREANDIVDGGLGNDTLIGGDGVGDTASFVSHDSVRGQQGTITLGLNGADGFARYTPALSLIGENDVLRSFENVTGSSLAETINGNELANTLAGRGGNDTVNGGAGGDTYDFRGPNPGSDRFSDVSGLDNILVDSVGGTYLRFGPDLRITLSAGTILIVNHFEGQQIESISSPTQTLSLATSTTGGSGSGIIAGTNQADVLDGGGGDDLLYGNKGRDYLLGGSGNDLLDAGKGADTLEGGAGDDTLEGGRGPDTFVFAPSVLNGTPGHDVVIDFGEDDKIDLRAFDTSFRRLDDDRDGRLEAGEGDGAILVQREGKDTILAFADGSIRIEDVLRMRSDDFLF